MSDFWSYIVAATVVITLISVVTLRPNIRLTTRVLKKPQGLGSSYRHQFLHAVEVENNGVFPVSYKIMGRSEHIKSLGAVPGKTERPLVFSKSVARSLCGLYKERINNLVLHQNVKEGKGPLVPGYSAFYRLTAGDRTANIEHPIGNFAFDDLREIDYDQSLVTPLWESYVTVIPIGFWGLPILRNLNTRRYFFTSASILIEAVDKLDY